MRWNLRKIDYGEIEVEKPALYLQFVMKIVNVLIICFKIIGEHLFLIGLISMILLCYAMYLFSIFIF